jgi:hypothetical protein
MSADIPLVLLRRLVFLREIDLEKKRRRADCSTRRILESPI